MAGYPVVDQGSSRSIGLTDSTAALTHSEHGIGAIIPWADRLYYSTYLATYNDGAGSRVGYIDKNFNDHVVLQTNGIHTARFIHTATNQLLIGPCVIGVDGTLNHTIANLVGVRLSGFAKHIVSPDTMVYAMTMEGKLYEFDVTTGADATLLIDVKATLSQTKVHYKACWTYAAPFAVTDRVIMVSNVQASPTPADSGVLVAVDPVGLTASAKSYASWIEIAGHYYPGNGGYTFAIGKDAKSALFGVMRTNSAEIYRYRMPQAGKVQDWYICQEWMRIRPVQTERMLMNAYGTWYNVSTWLNHITAGTIAAPGIENYGTAGTDYPIVEPIARYVDTVTDFCVFNGKFVIGTNNMSPQNGSFPNSGQPSSCIKFGDIEDLYDGGKPTGFGYIWYKEETAAGTNSEPMLIRGYDKKALHIYNAGAATVAVDVKLVKNSDVYTLTTVSAATNTLVTYLIPEGVGADWLHLATADINSSMTAWIECT